MTSPVQSTSNAVRCRSLQNTNSIGYMRQEESVARSVGIICHLRGAVALLPGTVATSAAAAAAAVHNNEWWTIMRWAAYAPVPGKYIMFSGMWLLKALRQHATSTQRHCSRYFCPANIHTLATTPRQLSTVLSSCPIYNCSKLTLRKTPVSRGLSPKTWRKSLTPVKTDGWEEFYKWATETGSQTEVETEIRVRGRTENATNTSEYEKDD